MKAMKLVMMAVVAVVMGSVFTSCLDSGNSRYPRASMVEVISYMGSVSHVLTDDGYKFIPNDTKFFEFKLDEKPLDVKRVLIEYYIENDEPIVEGKTEYNIEMANTLYFDLKSPGYEVIESKAPITKVALFAASPKFIDFQIEFPFIKYDLSNYQVYIDKLDNGTININLVGIENMENINSAKLSGLNASIRTPSLDDLRNRFSDFQVPSDGIVSFQITAKGLKDGSSMNYEDRKTEVFKIKYN